MLRGAIEALDMKAVFSVAVFMYNWLRGTSSASEAYVLLRWIDMHGVLRVWFRLVTFELRNFGTGESLSVWPLDSSSMHLRTYDDSDKMLWFVCSIRLQQRHDVGSELYTEPLSSPLLLSSFPFNATFGIPTPFDQDTL